MEVGNNTVDDNTEALEGREVAAAEEENSDGGGNDGSTTAILFPLCYTAVYRTGQWWKT
jgi:hypothetical protein